MTNEVPEIRGVRLHTVLMVFTFIFIGLQYIDEFMPTLFLGVIVSMMYLLRVRQDYGDTNSNFILFTIGIIGVVCQILWGVGVPLIGVSIGALFMDIEQFYHRKM